jgi:putative ATP-dependent endonuclease of the OLD family
MGRIRKIVIKNFRCFKYLEWMPNEGINCLIGHGDVGKSTLLDAIELCLGNRGNTQFTDADFYKLDVNSPIEITITLGDLDESLLNFDTYGQFIRGFNSSTGEITDEPEPETENVIDLHLKVMDDLEHSRTLYSDRSFAQGQRRNLSRPDREKLFPTRIGSAAGHHLTWGHGSILKKISDENMEAISDLSTARKWQKEFSSSATEKVPQTLAIIKDTAIRIGIPIEDVKAMLDINSTFLRGSGISPYDNNVIPLRSLGLGSTRLLIAELQRGVDAHSSIMLVDEVEHGLEPHRLIRLISSLGAKDDKPPHQVFMTSHSPVAIKELSTKQK